MSKKKKTESIQTTLGDAEEEERKKKTGQKKSTKKTPRKSTSKSSKTKKSSTKKTKKSKEKKAKPESALMKIPGIGETLAQRLADAGYETVEKLSKTSYKTLSKKVDGISEDGAKKLISDAKEKMKASKKPAKKSTKKKPTKKAPKKSTKQPKKSKKKTVKPEPALLEIPGIGETLAHRLADAGYETVEKLSKTRYKTLSKKVDGVSEDGAKKLISSAKDSLKKEKKEESEEAEIEESRPSLTEISGVGKKLEKNLSAAGYDSIARLSRANVSSLADRVDGLGEDRAAALVDAAKAIMKKREEEELSGTVKISAKKSEEKSPEKPKEPEKEEVRLEESKETPKKTSKKRDTPKKEKKAESKSQKRKTKAPPKRKKPKPKRSSSGLPVPESVSDLTVEMKKRWAKAAKRKKDVAEGKVDEEESEMLETVEVMALEAEDTQERLVETASDVLNETMLTGRPAFEIPSRSSDNIVWDEVRDLLLLGMKTINRPYHSLASVVDATRTARVMEIVFELLRSNLHATKREVFYSDVNLFRDQKYSDKIIEDVASMLQATRDSVHIVASARGSAMGRVKIRDGGDLIDLTKMGTGGWAVTPFLDQLEIVESDAEFIIVSEKDAAVMRLAEAKYWNRMPCIVLTGKGSGDIATRAFLKMLVKELEIPAFALVDSDPYGHYIYSVFLRGSKRLSYESPFIATPELKLLGVLSRDLDKFKIPKSVRIPMEPRDIKRVREMLKEPFVRQNKEWVEDLKLMLSLKEKAEIQAFASHSFEYLTDEYLPTKLETGDWI